MHFYAFITIFYGMNFKSKCMHENVAWNTSMKICMNMPQYSYALKILDDGDNL
jgi:hypothetical protein